MSGFDPTWLALREPHDHVVRDLDLTAAFVNALGPSPRLIDLGCGTGSNLRFLAPHLKPDQSWTCVDYDPVLLDRLQTTKPEAIEVTTLCLDLAEKLDDLEIGPGVGVTAAALLDLTSAVWLDRLAERCRCQPVLMTLSFDGRLFWDPIDPVDEGIVSAFLRHQQGEKGFGPALGADAANFLAERFRQMGHQVHLAPSDWRIGKTDVAMLRAMVDGIAGAAAEIDADLPIDQWTAKRREQIEQGELSMMVGHLDLLTLPG